MYTTKIILLFSICSEYKSGYRKKWMISDDTDVRARIVLIGDYPRLIFNFARSNESARWNSSSPSLFALMCVIFILFLKGTLFYFDDTFLQYELCRPIRPFLAVWDIWSLVCIASPDDQVVHISSLIYCTLKFRSLPRLVFYRLSIW